MGTLGSTLSTTELSTSDIALSVRVPQSNETITAGSSAVVVRRYTVASGTKLVIELAATLRIL